jgi:hypothetical protein
MGVGWEQSLESRNPSHLESRAVDKTQGTLLGIKIRLRAWRRLEAIAQAQCRVSSAPNDR